jgi:hypothetical protein
LAALHVSLALLLERSELIVLLPTLPVTLSLSFVLLAELIGVAAFVLGPPSLLFLNLGALLVDLLAPQLPLTPLIGSLLLLLLSPGLTLLFLGLLLLLLSCSSLFLGLPALLLFLIVIAARLALRLRRCLGLRL